MDAIFVFGDRIAQDRNGRLYTGTSFSQEILTDIWSISTIFTLMMRRDSVDSDDIQAFERMNPTPMIVSMWYFSPTLLLR